MGRQDRKMIPGETKALIPGSSVDFAIPRAGDLDLHSLLIRVNANLNITTAFSGTAQDYAQLLATFQVIADGEVIKQGTGRFLALGQQYRNTLFTYNVAPAAAIGAYGIQHQYVIDFSSVDAVLPKDTILRTGLYSNLVLRVFAAQVTDLYPVGAGAGTYTALTASVSYRYSQEYDARTVPWISTCYSITGVDLSAAHGYPGVEVKLSATGDGTWIKGIFVETYNSQTRAYSQSLTNIAFGQIHDKWWDLPIPDMVGWNAWDSEVLNRTGTYLADLTRVSEGPARLVDSRSMLNIAEPRLWLANNAQASQVADIHVFGFKMARQPAAA